MWNKIVIVGAGGTGSYLIMPLCRFLASINFTGKVIIADGDNYDLGNAERQNFALQKANTNKAQYHADITSFFLGDLPYEISYIPQYLSKTDVETIVDNGTIVINCADNNAIRTHVEEEVAKLHTACHICCGNEMRHGQVQIYLRKNNEDQTPSIFRSSPEFNSINDDRSSMSCEQIAQLPSGGQLIGANFMAASLALNFCINVLHPDRQNKLICFAYAGFDIFNNSIGNKDRHPLLGGSQ